MDTPVPVNLNQSRPTTSHFRLEEEFTEHGHVMCLEQGC